MRKLSAEERELWDKVRRTIRPLRPILPRAEEPAAPPPAAPLVDAAPAPVVPATAPKRSHPPAPPLAALETRARRRLKRGAAEVDGRLDLHGLREADAFSALMGFLRTSQMRGDRIVLVITGKGVSATDGAGVLRRTVPRWLALPEARPLIVGFEEAQPRHGGGGALYVRLRRRRP